MKEGASGNVEWSWYDIGGEEERDETVARAKGDQWLVIVDEADAICVGWEWLRTLLEK